MHSIFPILKKYQSSSNSFDYKLTDSLDKTCNAPKDQAGVYILSNPKTEDILYIGSSGHFYKDKGFIPRENGLWGRIVKGKQSMSIGDATEYKPRHIIWPLKMKEDHIDVLRISWYITHIKEHHDLPAYVEAVLVQNYYKKYRRLPLWQKKF